MMENLNTLCNVLPEPIAFVNRGYEILFANKAFYNFFSLDSDKAKKIYFNDLFIESEFHGRLKSHIENCLDGNEIHVVNEFYLNNKRLYLDFFLNYLADDSSGESGFICRILDVTNQFNDKRKLLSQNVKYKALFDQNQLNILIIDPDSRLIIDANPEACKFYGYEYNELIGKPISEINILSDKEIYEKMHLALEKKQTFFEFRHKLASGEIKDVHVFSSKTHFDEDNFLFSIIIDVTERKRINNQVKELNNVLEQRNAHLNALLNISHLVEESESSIDDIINGTVPIVQNAFVGHKISCEILYEDRLYRSSHFFEMGEKIEDDLFLKGSIVGYIKIISDKKFKDKFTQNEIKLLKTLASRISRICERVKYEQELLFHEKLMIETNDRIARQNEKYSEVNEKLTLKNIEIKKINLKLVDSEMQFRRLFNDAPIAIVMLSEDQKIIKTNKAFNNLFKYYSKDIVGKNEELFTIKDKNDKVSAYREMLSKNMTESVYFERKYIDSNGEIFDCLVTEGMIPGKNNEYVYIDQIVDITDRKLQEQCLKDSEEKYRRLFENMLSGFVLHQAVVNESNEVIDFEVIEVNPAFTNITGLKRIEVLHKRFSEIYIDIEQKQFENIKKVVETGESIKIEHYSSRNDKTYKIFIFSPQKMQIAFIIHDITFEKRAEEELAKEMKVKTSLFELSKKILHPEIKVEDIAKTVYEYALEITNSSNGYVSKVEKSNGDIHKFYESQMMDEEADIPKDTIIFKKIGDKYVGLTGHCLNTKEGFYTNKPKEHEASIGLPKKHVPINNFLSVPAIAMGELVGQISLANKPTDYDEKDLHNVEQLAQIYAIAIYRFESEIEMKKAKEKAEVSDKLKSSFLANVSHEIRTPLNAILGFSQVLIQEDLSKDDRSEFLDIILANSNQLLTIINDILEISRIESGDLKLKYSEVNIAELLKNVYISYKDLASSKSLDLNYEFDGLDEKDYYMVDKVRLRQIIGSLLDNALKFAEVGYVKFGVKKQNGDLLFYVEDTGIGIDEKDKEIVFDRFRQVDDFINKKHQGIGLGLAISKAFVEEMGGKIWIDSKVGQGSVFYFSLPLQSATNNKVTKMDENKSKFEYDWTGRKILIVEDTLANALLIKKYIQKTKADYLLAENGLEAVELTRKNSDIDVILMDLKMPEMDGYEATRKIREFKVDIPIIAQTAYALSEDDKKAKAAGCNDYITKPLNQSKLLNLISNYFDIKS